LGLLFFGCCSLDRFFRRSKIPLFPWKEKNCPTTRRVDFGGGAPFLATRKLPVQRKKLAADLNALGGSVTTVVLRHAFFNYTKSAGHHKQRIRFAKSLI